jgi:hypothetical protein
MNIPAATRKIPQQTSAVARRLLPAVCVTWFAWFAFTCSNPVDNRPSPPRLSLVSDTSASAKDSLVLTAHSAAGGVKPAVYLWFLDGQTLTPPAAADSQCRLLFGVADTGSHIVVVKALGGGTSASEPDTARIEVLARRPRIAINNDTTVAAFDSIVLHATRLDTFGTSVRYAWARNGTSFSDTTAGPRFSVLFGKADVGERVVRVKAVDSRRLESNVDSARIAVHLFAPTVTIAHDTTVPINDPVALHAAGADTNGHVAKYLWALDGSRYLDTTVADSLVHAWSRADTGRRIVVLVKAIDDDALESGADSVRVVVRPKQPPSVTMTPDTSVFINDSFSLAALAVPGSESPVVAFLWAFDNGPFNDTTATGMLPMRFSRADTGRHVVRVKAVDRDTLVSFEDSAVVLVRLGRPHVTAMADTVVFIDDSVSLHATGADSNGTVKRYLWAVDDHGFSDTTTSGVLRMAWGAQQAGGHIVRVVAVDDDTILSNPDSGFVTVRLGTPVVQAGRDTSLPWGDTLTLTTVASDTNGSIVTYLWNTNGGDAWTDSSVTYTLKFTSTVHSDRKVIAAVRDDDGLATADTFTVHFLSRPCSVSVSGLRPLDTAFVHSTDARPFAFSLRFSAGRMDGVADTFTYSVWSGVDSLSVLTEGLGFPDTTGALFSPDTGTRYWKVMAVDVHGDTATTAVSRLTIKIERRICFVGHSIMTGFGGTYGLGGFRRMVVDTLRTASGTGNRFKCEGPIMTQNLVPTEDDSCCAVNGKTCSAIYDSMQEHPNTNADVWVYMNGVNEGYQFPTYDRFWWRDNYAAATIDTMHGRNPKSEIYVLNGLPFPGDTMGDFNYRADSTFTANLPKFNRMLDSVVTIRRQDWRGRGEGGVWLVNAFDSLAALPDSSWNPVYFSDYLHPNQNGYDRLGRAILKAMRDAKSSYLK